jgi:iron complex transport system substrate-binding protein
MSLLAITACYHTTLPSPKPSFAPTTECRIIKHKFGETCVPLTPQRIVALNPMFNLDPLIALGIKPIGFGSYNEGEDFLLGVSIDEMSKSTNVGNPFQPSLEKILLLKPDLILDSDFGKDEQRYKLLSAIAPTVSVPPSTPESTDYFKQNLRYIAQIVNRESKAEDVLIQYQKRVRELQKLLGKRLQQIEASVIFYGEGYIWTLGKHFATSQVFDDVGLNHKKRPHGHNWFLSIETIAEYDADVLFIVDIDKKSSSFYFQNPMFSSLEAVKKKRTYIVDQESWRGQGISGANKILDDLFKYLVNTP